MAIGKFTYPEISAQHEALLTAFEQLGKQPDWVSRFLTSHTADETIFIGSGSSYYQAQTMAAIYRKWLGKSASAMPSSELYLQRDYNTAPSHSYVLIGVSRSGESSEVILALQSVSHLSNWTCCGITCYEDSTMAKLVPCLVSPKGKEASTVMTKSFSSMTYMMIAAIASAAERSDLLQQLARLPKLAKETAEKADAFINAFLQQHSFNKYIYLGMGPYYGLANEANLKIKEMSYVWAESYGTLEFRHGPKSVIEKGTLVVLLLSKEACQHELKVAQEMKEYGATVLILTGDPSINAPFADALFKLEGIADAEDGVQCVLYLSLLQYLGFYTAVHKGVDPDSPRNLTQVVII